MAAHRLTAVLPVLGLVVALAACGDGTASDEVPTTPSTADPSVLVSRGVRYAAAPQGWSDPTLDLYLPADAGVAPLAVIVPDAGGDPGSSNYVPLARDLAARGVIAAVAHWGVASPELTTLGGRPLQDVVAQTEQTTAEVSCAVAVAVAKAGLSGAAPGRPLVVVGHGTGANAAAMAVLTVPRQFAGCFATGPKPSVSAALLWDGDWLGSTVDDLLGAGVSSFLRAYSPWPAVDSSRRSTFVEVGVNANRLEGLSVGAGPTSSYVAERDPGGAITHDLEQVGAFDNGTIDPVDTARGFAVGLRDAGIQSREREVHGEGDPGTLGPRVRALLVQDVVQLTLP